jgi:single-strand DNA-binding protein
MNNFNLQAVVLHAPTLRFVGDDETPIGEMVVEFPGIDQDATPASIQVIAWKELAQEMQNLQVGQRVTLEGSLSMNTIDRPEGFKEKRAVFTVQRIHPELPSLVTPAVEPAPTKQRRKKSPATV